MQITYDLKFRPFIKSLFLRQTGLILLALMFVYSAIDRWFLAHLQKELSSMSSSVSKVWLWAVLSAVLGVVIPQIFSLLIFSADLKKGRLFFLRSHFEQTLIEALRSTGSILWSSFVFLIPGVYRFFQYSFVPVIVCFDESYQKGQVEILRKSRELASPKIVFQIASLYLFFIVFVSLLTDPLKGAELDLQSIHYEILASCLEVFGQSVFIYFLLKIYLRRSHAFTDVPMARS